MNLGSILVTGGAGYFGKAFVRHLLDNNLSDRICIFSRDEYKHAVMRDEFNDDPRLRFMVGDIRDLPRLTTAMRGIDVCVHTSALKRIEVGHYSPSEMLNTNVIGSQNVIDACFAEGVKKSVFLSTDKAYQGVSAYGQSKALAESLFMAANNMHSSHGPEYVVTRFGNVWGSTGSIVPNWKRMIANGDTRFTVTSRECTRFLMLINEAVEFVLDAIVNAHPNEPLIPRWLPAYSVGDLEEAFGITARETGLPAWEKLHEGMCDGITSDVANRVSVEYLRGLISEST